MQTKFEVAKAANLTPRQADCMELVRRGLTAKQIAHKLGISHRTVEQHIATVMEILQVNNRLAAVARLQEIEREHERSSLKFMLDDNADMVDFSNAFITAPPARPSFERAPSRSIFPPMGGVANDASRNQRLIWMVRVATLAIMLSCLVFLTILGLSDMAAFAKS